MGYPRASSLYIRWEQSSQQTYPSGHDFDMASLSMSEGIGEELDGEEAEADYTAKKAISAKIIDAYFVIGPSTFRSFSGFKSCMHLCT